ncbi:N-methyltransferase tcpN [Pseudocercospora fuligena]|uniref:N-methyltransferase tcpN n=1 Tax=Pseudocercospora fuligena TaxID=685502 RepID=A0A8H6RIM5_9PEZI|nr:N-methyltransferase tcpN [Pseudocercospora fuligena]
MPYEYVLGGSEWAATRLRFQDELTKTNFDGHRLDPSIRVQHGMRIADVATGTGSWACDIAEQYPGVQVEGLDINLSEIPANGYWPKNLTFTTINLLEDMRERLLGRYDIVNVQYIMPIVDDDVFPVILGRLKSLLKPDGYLQWTDSNTNKWTWFTPTTTVFSARTAHNPDIAPTLTKLLLLAMNIIRVRSKSQDWLNRMESGFASAGFENVKQIVPKPKPSTVQPLVVNFIWTMDEGFQNILESKECGDEMRGWIEEWFENRKQLIAEVREQGVGMNTFMTRCVGRKKDGT